MKKFKLDLQIVLPSDAHACDACSVRLLESLRKTSGVFEAHIEAPSADEAVLCVHYDPETTDVVALRDLVDRAGIELRNRFGHLAASIAGLRHERQRKIVEAFYARQVGVVHASVALASRRLFVEFDPSITSRETLLAQLPLAGLELREDAPARGLAVAEPHDEHGHGDTHGHGHGSGHTHGGPFGERSELVFSLACGVLTGVGWLVSRFGPQSIVPTLLFVMAYGLGAWFTVQEAVVALRARKFEIDFLMLLAAAGAAALGEWFEGALLLFLFTLGHSLEGYAMGRARAAIEALAKLVPETALRIDSSGVESEVPVTTLEIGQHVRVRPNTRMPVDGFVLSGEGSVNQAPITGESVPVDKRPVPDADEASKRAASLPAEHRVFAGSINGASVLTVYVGKLAGESTLARVAKMVAEAETQKSASQRFTDRFERIFVPVILCVVFALLFAWVVIDEPFARSFYRAMAVLVAASPCALAIATPSAVLSGVARAARSGVLFKGGAHLEALGMIGTFAFDKTGTLTEGRPKLIDVATLPGVEEVDLLQVAAAVEKQSDHPLASAIVDGAALRLPEGTAGLDAADVRAVTGYGIEANVRGQAVVVGKPGMFSREAALPDDIAALVTNLQTKGRTVVVVQKEGRFLGVLGIMDAPRESAREVIAALHRIGVTQTLMLTGDNQAVADAVAKDVGITLARGDLLPEDKVAAIRDLASTSSLVAMVGDGVNDAPAMANATVGIAMGAGGSDVALETADVALMADDLRALPFAIGLSRAARAIIRQNLWASLGMVAFLVPATMFDFAGIGVAVMLHEGSTLLVVVNALRLLAYRDDRSPD